MYFVKITVDLPENGPVRWTLVYPAQSRGTLQWYPSVKAAIAAHLLLAEQPPED